MKFLTLLLASSVLALGFTGCQTNPFASVGVGATYTDQAGETYGGNVNATFKDGKTVRPVRTSKIEPSRRSGLDTRRLATRHAATPVPRLISKKPSFARCLGVGLARLVDTPAQPNRNLEDILFPMPEKR